MPDPITSQEPTVTIPEGEYAIVEILGHQTIVGRVAEIERFGTKLLHIEPIWRNELLAPVLQGGSSIYRFTACDGDTAFRNQAKSAYQLPDAVRAVMPPLMLSAPASSSMIDPETLIDDGDDDFDMSA